MTSNINLTRCLFFTRQFAIVVLIIAAIQEQVIGQVNVLLDYTDFQTRLNSATSTAGVPNFSPTEVQTIQGNVLNYLNTAFNGYQINFSTSNPGGSFETLTFGLTGSGFGLADRIDFRNLVGNDVARVFTANFSPFLNPADPRSLQITSLSNSLGGTASHEVGHNLGLEHRDPYGIAGIASANLGGGHQTFGMQNTHIMATGITGLTNEQRIVPRTFSDLSHAKLQFANGIVPNPIAPIAEQGAPHSAAANAQQVNFSNFAAGPSAYDAGYIVQGELTTNNEFDFYAFQLTAGSYTTMQIISSVLGGTNNINSNLALLDSNGTTILSINDNTQVSSTGVNIGGTTYGNDSSIYNFLAPRNDTFYLRVSAATTTDLGAYSLFVTTTAAAIPEPGTSLVSAFFAILLISQRRKS
jgi:hypothetical protein